MATLSLEESAVRLNQLRTELEALNLQRTQLTGARASLEQRVAAANGEDEEELPRSMTAAERTQIENELLDLEDELADMDRRLGLFSSLRQLSEEGAARKIMLEQERAAVIETIAVLSRRVRGLQELESERDIGRANLEAELVMTAQRETAVGARVSDVMREIVALEVARQGTLAKQKAAAGAAAANAVQEELSRSVSNNSDPVAQITARLTETRRDLQVLEQQTASLEAEKKQLLEEVTVCKKEFQSMNLRYVTDLGSLNTEKIALKTELMERDDEVRGLKKRLLDSDNNNGLLEERVDTLSAQLAAVRNQLSTYTEMKMSESHLFGVVNSLTQENMTMREERESLRTELRASSNQLTVSRAQIAKLEANLQAALSATPASPRLPRGVPTADDAAGMAAMQLHTEQEGTFTFPTAIRASGDAEALRAAHDKIAELEAELAETRDTATAEIETLNAAVRKLSDDLAAAENRAVLQATAAANELRAAQARGAENVAAVEREMLAVKAVLRQHELTVQAQQARITALQTQCADTEKDVFTAQTSAHELNERNETLVQKLQAAERDRDSALSKLAAGDLEGRPESTSSAALVEALKAEVAGLIEERDALLAKAQEDIPALERATEAHATLVGKLSAAEHAREEAERARDEAASRIAGLQIALRSVSTPPAPPSPTPQLPTAAPVDQDAVAALHARINALTLQVASLTRERDSLAARVATDAQLRHINGVLTTLATAEREAGLASGPVSTLEELLRSAGGSRGTSAPGTPGVTGQHVALEIEVAGLTEERDALLEQVKTAMESATELQTRVLAAGRQHAEELARVKQDVVDLTTERDSLLLKIEQDLPAVTQLTERVAFLEAAAKNAEASATESQQELARLQSLLREKSDFIEELEERGHNLQMHIDGAARQHEAAMQELRDVRAAEQNASAGALAASRAELQQVKQEHTATLAAKAQEALTQLNVMQQRLEGEANIQKARADEAETRLQRALDQVEETSNQGARALLASETNARALEAQVAALRTQLAAASSASVGADDSTVAAMADDVARLTAMIADNNAVAKKLEANMMELSTGLKQAESERDSFVEKLRIRDVACADLTEELAAARAQVEASGAAEIELEQQLVELQGRGDQLRAQVLEARALIQRNEQLEAEKRGLESDNQTLRDEMDARDAKVVLLNEERVRNGLELTQLREERDAHNSQNERQHKLALDLSGATIGRRWMEQELAQLKEENRDLRRRLQGGSHHSSEARSPGDYSSPQQQSSVSSPRANSPEDPDAGPLITPRQNTIYKSIAERHDNEDDMGLPLSARRNSLNSPRINSPRLNLAALGSPRGMHIQSPRDRVDRLAMAAAVLEAGEASSSDDEEEGSEGPLNEDEAYPPVTTTTATTADATADARANEEDGEAEQSAESGSQVSTPEFNADLLTTGEIDRVVSWARDDETCGVNQLRQRNALLVVYVSAMAEKMGLLRESVESAASIKGVLTQALVQSQSRLRADADENIELKDELDNLRKENQELYETCNQLQEKFAALQQEELNLTHDDDDTDANEAIHLAERAVLERELDTLRSALALATATASPAMAPLEVLQLQLAAVRESLATSEAQAETLAAEVARRQGELEEAQTELAESKLALLAMRPPSQVIISPSSKALGSPTYSKIEAVREQELLQTITTLRKENDALRQQCERAREEVQDLTEAVNKSMRAESEHETSLSHARSAMDFAINEREVMAAELQKLEMSFNSLQAQSRLTEDALKEEIERLSSALEYPIESTPARPQRLEFGSGGAVAGRSPALTPLSTEPALTRPAQRVSSSPTKIPRPATAQLLTSPPADRSFGSPGKRPESASPSKQAADVVPLHEVLKELDAERRLSAQLAEELRAAVLRGTEPVSEGSSSPGVIAKQVEEALSDGAGTKLPADETGAIIRGVLQSFAGYLARTHDAVLEVPRYEIAQAVMVVESLASERASLKGQVGVLHDSVAALKASRRSQETTGSAMARAAIDLVEELSEVRAEAGRLTSLSRQRSQQDLHADREVEINQTVDALRQEVLVLRAEVDRLAVENLSLSQAVAEPLASLSSLNLSRNNSGATVPTSLDDPARMAAAHKAALASILQLKSENVELLRRLRQSVTDLAGARDRVRELEITVDTLHGELATARQDSERADALMQKLISTQADLERTNRDMLIAQGTLRIAEENCKELRIELNVTREQLRARIPDAEQRRRDLETALADTTTKLVEREDEVARLSTALSVVSWPNNNLPGNEEASFLFEQPDTVLQSTNLDQLRADLNNLSRIQERLQMEVLRRDPTASPSRRALDNNTAPLTPGRQNALGLGLAALLGATTATMVTLRLARGR